ncbi:cell division protein CrgA [Acaricomes phytoseiuli]|uniref:cell division protein CrgA n=1 Tax=Acaricomes phytoseiuli TaxID=291968 RepID=UPI000475F1AC|nr:cell division protein CrgA [Acaricomes phytoseiuli]MCW1248679.1 cell division protein CrgA [Acaricomes phytoseiuli]
MPESKSRRRDPKPTASASGAKTIKPNPVWYKPVMFGLMILGLLWIITFYITASTPGVTQLPIPSIGPWNIAVGFGVIIVGFLMTTRWR